MTMVSSNDNSCSSATSIMHKIKENKSINQIQLHSFIRPRPKRGRAQIGESVSSSKLPQDDTNSDCHHNNDSMSSSILKTMRKNKNTNEDLI
jgi:hypothetical protein